MYHNLIRKIKDLQVLLARQQSWAAAWQEWKDPRNILAWATMWQEWKDPIPAVLQPSFVTRVAALVI